MIEHLDEAVPGLHPPTGQLDVRALDWFRFERLVALLFEHEGFQVDRPYDSNSDGGIDFAVTKQGITFGVQCKHWKASQVGVEGVRAFLAALHDRNMRNGFIVTLEGYTQEAMDCGRRNGIDLMDETMLLENLETVKWRFNSAFLCLWGDELKTCPRCESPTVLRVALKDEYGGRKIWGCSTFPDCMFKMTAN